MSDEHPPEREPQNAVDNGQPVVWRDGHYRQAVETDIGWIEAVVD